MKLLYEFGVIMAVTFLGEICHAVLPLPIPASIYGLLLMLFALCTKIIKLEQVKVAGDFLLDIMPPMFIPAGVGLLHGMAGSETGPDPCTGDHRCCNRRCYGSDRPGVSAGDLADKRKK